MLINRDVAEAFSSHRFAETYDSLSDDIVWAVPGQPAVVGCAAVRAACEQTMASLDRTEVTVLRFLVVVGEVAVAVDSVTRYTDRGGAVSVVSSSDFYEFSDTHLVAITSYAVELDPAKLGPTAYIGAA